MEEKNDNNIFCHSVPEVIESKSKIEEGMTFQDFLNKIGINSDIDFVFLDYFQKHSRMALTKSERQMSFIFDLVCTKTENSNLYFPNANWVEKATLEFNEFVEFQSDNTPKVKDIYILWTTWSYNPATDMSFFNMKIKTPGDFHVFLVNEVKQKHRLDIESYYKEIDNRRGQIYFDTIGTRSNGESVYIFYFDQNYVIVFEAVLPVFYGQDINTIGTISPFIHETIPVVGQILYALDIYCLPEGDYLKGVAPIEVDYEFESQEKCDDCEC